MVQLGSAVIEQFSLVTVEVKSELTLKVGMKTPQIGQKESSPQSILFFSFCLPQPVHTLISHNIKTPDS